MYRRRSAFSIFEVQIMTLIFSLAALGYIKIQHQLQTNQILQVQRILVYQSLRNTSQALQSLAASQITPMLNALVAEPNCAAQPAFICMTYRDQNQVFTAQPCYNDQWIQFYWHRRVCKLQEQGIKIEEVNHSCQPDCQNGIIILQVKWHNNSNTLETNSITF